VAGVLGDSDVGANAGANRGLLLGGQHHRRRRPDRADQHGCGGFRRDAKHQPHHRGRHYPDANEVVRPVHSMGDAGDCRLLPKISGRLPEQRWRSVRFFDPGTIRPPRTTT
jgi:hypothetical protein